MRLLLRLLPVALACAPFAGLAKDTPAPATKPAAPAPTLVVGGKAPKFKPTDWIQGEPVAGFEKGKVYVIELWATWCGGCVSEIPHLNELHKKYADRGLVVIGTHVFNQKETPQTVAAFVKKRGDAMSYRIAFDSRKEGAVVKDWYDAGGIDGIPEAFVVRDGILLWHGHPAALSDSKIKPMLEGTYDWEKAEKARLEKAALKRAKKAAEKAKGQDSPPAQ